MCRRNCCSCIYCLFFNGLGLMDIEYAPLCTHLVTVEFYRACNEIEKVTQREKEKKEEKRKKELMKTLNITKERKGLLGFNYFM